MGEAGIKGQRGPGMPHVKTACRRHVYEEKHLIAEAVRTAVKIVPTTRRHEAPRGGFMELDFRVAQKAAGSKYVPSGPY